MKILTLFFFLICISCKPDKINRTFIGYLPIVAAKSPASVKAGQLIVSNIRCESPAVNGSVFFLKFNIKEYNLHEFNISANALYKDWNTQFSMPLMWMLDTSATIVTKTQGLYILNFYNAEQLVKSDTVRVN